MKIGDKVKLNDSAIIFPVLKKELCIKAWKSTKNIH